MSCYLYIRFHYLAHFLQIKALIGLHTQTTCKNMCEYVCVFLHTSLHVCVCLGGRLGAPSLQLVLVVVLLQPE